MSALGVVGVFGSNVFALNVGTPGGDDPHSEFGVSTIYFHPIGDWEVADHVYLYDRSLLVGAAKRMLALVVTFWDAFDGKCEMPIIPATREVHYRDDHGQT